MNWGEKAGVLMVVLAWLFLVGSGKRSCGAAGSDGEYGGGGRRDGMDW
jgi:hypothetical protein